ncbi:MAG: hypothetical protein CVT72_00850 [Alphaproteobacteria bacterium HGW-Alphaproteobacteria-11]|nr:MAG: hypothetical protein CVT72_00850 [Alphaproteobacteria bacterium HGW-Alphaproteobacteria-11]
MTDLTYRGAAHHGEKPAGATGSTTLRYRGASYRATPHDKPKASHVGLRYRGIPQHD